MWHKEDVLVDSFHVIDEACAEGRLEQDSFDVTFENLCANNNITVLVISADRTVVRATNSDTRWIMGEFLDILFTDWQREPDVLLNTEDYTILKKTDSRLESEYLVLSGTLSNGNMILMRSALESIRESVKLSNQFLVYIAVVATTVSMIVGVFMSRWVTQPIRRLTDISRRMAEFDFEAKFSAHGKRHNEIDELGEHMNALSETLERTISELKNANNQLLRDIEEQAKTDEMRKEFLANASHELKTPLALIQGYAEGLLDAVNKDEESRNFYCEVIVDEAEKMSALVRKIMALSQLESGEESVKIDRFDLTELIHHLLRSWELVLKQKEIRVTAYPKEPMYVWADAFWIDQVLDNYFSNAVHHVKAPYEISVRYELRGDLLRVSVFNSGDAIPDAELEKIWMKFYKVDKAHTREYGGSGIGLSVVRAVMESLHRECGVENRQDGVEFWFELDRKCYR